MVKNPSRKDAGQALVRFLWLGLLLAPVPSSSVTFREFPTSPVSGWYITSGPDQALWFTQNGSFRVGRIDLSGDFTQGERFGGDSVPWGLTAGPDGNLWVADEGLGSIIRLSPAGTWKEFPMSSQAVKPLAISVGPDRNLWFTTYDRIGKITPAGVITEYPVPTPTPFLLGITSGPDGNLWFTESRTNKIGRITLEGQVAEFPLPQSGSSPLSITQGPDGNLWFTQHEGNRIGRISTQGVITEFPLPHPDSKPSVIVRGPDGNLWFTESSGRIGRITPKGAITEFDVPTPEGRPIGLTVGPDGNLWFTYDREYRIVRMTLGGTPITGPCVPTETALCIDDQAGDRRFKVEVEYASAQAGGVSGHGKAIPLASLGVNRGGLFWFFSQDNPELIVKILNGCANNGKFWAFISGGTNVGMTITVSDTVTGEVHSYYNRDLTPFAPIQDTVALSCGE